MESYSQYNVAVILVAAFGSLFTGYALSIIATTLGQPTFYTSLDLEVDPRSSRYSHTTSILSASNGIYFAGAMLGAGLSAATLDRFGRLNALRLGALIGLIGSVLQTAAINQGMYLVARLLTGAATGDIMAGMPIYFSEIAPPHSRGLMAGMHGIGINVGFSMAGWIGFACYYSAGSQFGWRFPNAVLILWSMALLVGTFFIPESPRWLVRQKKESHALAILCRLHYDANDATNEFARRELELIKVQSQADLSALDDGGKLQIFTKATYLKRVKLAVMVMLGAQNTGILVINNYNALLYASLGFDAAASLAMSASFNTVGLFANVIGAFVSDRWGRRNLMITGYSVVTVTFIIATGLVARYSEVLTKPYAIAAVTLFYLNIFGYGSCIDVNQFTIATEIFPSHLRGLGVSLSIGSTHAAGLLWVGLAPTAQASIGWKYYLVFVVLGLVHLVYLYFYLPETAGLALEEMDGLFGMDAAGHLATVDIELAPGELSTRGIEGTGKQQVEEIEEAREVNTPSHLGRNGA